MRLEQNLNVPSLEESRPAAFVNILALVVWLVAGAVVFLPFAFNTSPFDAVTLRVPGDQGNWWHALAGAPFFLAFPMIWLRIRYLFSKQLSTSTGRRLILTAAGLSACGTISVEMPFLLHSAGTSEWQRVSVLSLGLGIVIVNAIIMFVAATIFPRPARVLSLWMPPIRPTLRCVWLSTVRRPVAFGQNRAGWLP